MSKVYARLKVGDLDIVATRDPPPAGFTRGGLFKSAYPVEVNGVLRGVLVYQVPGWRSYDHHGWVLRSLLSLDLLEHAGPFHGRVVARVYTGVKAKEAVNWLLNKIPEELERGALPTAEEAVQRREEARRQSVEAKARQAEDAARARARAAQARARDLEAWDEMMAGLASLQDRPDLTNLERAGLKGALDRLKRMEPARPDLESQT